MKRHLARLTICVLAVVSLNALSGLSQTVSADQQCVDHSKDPAGCQPSTFDTPMAQTPSVRVNRQGQIDPHRLRQTRRRAPSSLRSDSSSFAISSTFIGCR